MLRVGDHTGFVSKIVLVRSTMEPFTFGITGHSKGFSFWAGCGGPCLWSQHIWQWRGSIASSSRWAWATEWDFISKSKPNRMSQEWWGISVISALGKRRQKGQEFKVILSLLDTWTTGAPEKERVSDFGVLSTIWVVPSFLSDKCCYDEHVFVLCLSLISSNFSKAVVES